MSNLDAVATQIRRLSLEMTTRAGSGHATSSLSCADIMAVLFSQFLHYDPKLIGNLYNDRFILSKGHASPVLYATYALSGWIPMRELTTLRQKTGRLEGHPTRVLPFVDVATGSLGQGLANGLGMAWGLRNLEPQPMVYVLMGDGELAEGSVWEALAIATNLHSSRICIILDLNGLGQSGPSLYQGQTEVLAKRLESFGWRTHIVDGHDTQALSVTFGMVNDLVGPHAVLCNTIKGKGVSFLEGKEGWHGKALSEAELKTALVELGDPQYEVIKVQVPLRTLLADRQKLEALIPPHFEAKVATKQAFGMAVAALCKQDPDLVVLDADVKNSTQTDVVCTATPEQLIEVSIAESTMVGMAEGLDVVGKHAVVSTFAAFLTRAHDQLRMTSLSERSILVNGAYAGCSIGRDGASQMGLEDLAMMRSLASCQVLYPADAYAAYALTLGALKQNKMAYIRTTREPTPLLYAPDTKFPIGGSKTHGESSQDLVTIVACGVTLFEALKAQSQLRTRGILVRVIDLYSIKPIDSTTLLAAVKATGGKILVVEDHHSEGGVGDAVRSALDGTPVKFKHLSVHGIPHSASFSEELTLHAIDAEAIMKAIQEF